MSDDPRMPTRYPSGTVRALLQSEHVSEPTRVALVQRLERDQGDGPVFLAPDAYATLRAAASRLLALDASSRLEMVVATLEADLASGASDGWRYADMPADGDAMRLGLAGLEETARLRFDQPFISLHAERQDDVLLAVQTNIAEGNTWQQLPAARFFEELLTALSAILYADPMAQEEIGYVGMADLPGWNEIGLNDLAAREPRPVSGSDG